MLGGIGILECSAGGDHQLFVLTERDLPARPARTALLLQRAGATVSEVVP
jgi:hypothetical protein